MDTKTAVLLVNLGTPSSYKGRDVYKYLNQFLTDKRVITLPYLKRNLLVRGIIVPFRYKQSAKSYSEIWQKEGSPLDLYTKRSKELLQETLGDDYVVEYAMRYQKPSIESTLKSLLTPQIKKLVLLPLFPQYASSTTGSVVELVFDELKKIELFPEIQVITHFYDHPKLIDAFCDLAKQCQYEDYDHILMSFHGLPEKHLTKGDRCNHCLKKTDCCKSMSYKNQLCYSAQCYQTAYQIANQLRLEKDSYTICFQSRLGKDPWIKPFTINTIKELPQKGYKKVLVMCPSFVCDCLETLHEIQIEYKEDFIEAGGETLDLMPGLNTHPLYIEALKSLVVGAEKKALATIV